jgi:hypothetical protein
MNKRIKELAEQATINIGDEFHPIDFFHKEKFAELIVRECAEVGDSGDPLQDGGIARMIKEHFGVKP